LTEFIVLIYLIYSYSGQELIIIPFSLHEKNDFIEASKILLDIDTKNFVGTLKIMSDAAKSFDILAISSTLIILIILIVQQNYFSDLYPAKILNLSAKSFFPCKKRNKNLENI